MAETPKLEALRRLLEKKLSKEDLALLKGEPRPTSDSEYEAAIKRVGRRLSVIEQQLSRTRDRIDDRYGSLVDEPEGRQRVLLQNSPPVVLIALCEDCMRKSYAARFADVARSLELARLAVDAAALVAETDFLAAEPLADLQAETLANLANALRINADFAGARKALSEAGRLAALGTGDRRLKATLLSFEADLLHHSGRYEEAAELQRRECALWRLLGDDEKLAIALLNRGRTLAGLGALREACPLLKEAAILTSDLSIRLAALFPVSFCLARQGNGVDAWLIVCAADVAILLIDADKQLRTRQNWVKGITHRLLGDLRAAEKLLCRVRQEFTDQGLRFQRAFVSLDLACVYAAQGRLDELKSLAEETYADFMAEGLWDEANVALLYWHRAAKAEELTEALAAEVANFVFWSRHNRKLRFKWPKK